MNAASMSTGKAALFGLGGAAIGALLGAVVTNILKKKKKTTES